MRSRVLSLIYLGPVRWYKQGEVACHGADDLSLIPGTVTVEGEK